MLKNGFLYQEELNKTLYTLWYEPEYQYYFSGRNHYPITMNRKDGDETERVFVSVNSKGKLMGYIGYSIDPCTNGVLGLHIIRFPEGDKLVFGRDILQCIDDMFVRFGYNRLEWGVVVGNPAQQMYEKYLSKFGGRYVGYKTQAATDETGRLCDFAMYEILRKDYLYAGERRKNNQKAYTL